MSAVLLGFACAPASFAQSLADCVIEPHLVVDVSTSEVGVLGEVGVDKGDPVFAGDVLGKLETDVERAALELTRNRSEASGELRFQRNSHAFNSRKRDRFHQLHDRNIVSRQDYDEVRTEEVLSGLRVKQVTEDLALARLEVARDEKALARRTIRSPIDGVVVQRYKEAGEFVDGDPVVQVAQLDPLRIEAIAPLEMMGRISIGAVATVLPELGWVGELEATVTHVDPIADVATATFGIRLSVPNPEHAVPAGIKCQLNVVASEEAPVLPHRLRLEAAAKPAPSPSLAAASSRLKTEAQQSSPVVRATLVRPGPLTPQSMPVALASDSMLSPKAQSEKYDEAPGLPAKSVSAVSAKPHAPPAPAGPSGPSGKIALPSPRARFASHEGTGRQCARVGPIRDRVSADALAEQVRGDSGIPVQTTKRQTTEDATIVLSAASDKSRKALEARADQAQLNDYARINTGRWAGRLSFGVFVDAAAAKNRVKRLEAAGIPATSAPYRIKRTAYWLEVAPAQATGTLQLSTERAREALSGYALEVGPCDPTLSG